MEKNTFGKEVNLNGEYIYNVEKILVECEAKYNDKNSFIEYLSKLLNEKQKDLLLRLYSIAEKQFILSILEKTLKVINKGGITKNNENNPKANDELQNLFNEIMNDIREKENDLKVKFNNGTISFEKYTHLMNELSKSKRKTREAYMKNAR